MAGGMSKRGGHGPMTERVARSRGEEPPTPDPPPALKHCWVRGRHGRLPGLLLEWRRTATGYQGRVLHAVLEDEDWVVVEEWLPAELLEPAS